MKYFCIVMLIALAAVAHGQAGETPEFRSFVENRLKRSNKVDLNKICPADDPVADRVFRDYGAIFVSSNRGKLPPTCVFDSEEEVQAFQAAVDPDVASIGGTQVTLQKAAMTALKEARAEAAKLGVAITPRGGSEASTRSYSKTTDLWKSRFNPGLTHWVARGKISSADAARAQRAPIRKQVEMVLAWEKRGYYFSTDFSKSILYSVAAPGASQHIFMLALDVSQFADRQVRQILARHGWFQTVKSDLPHFTYIGVTEAELPGLGLTRVTAGGQTFWIPNM